MTVQVRASQSRGGFWKLVVVDGGVAAVLSAVVSREEYLEGMRSAMADCCCVSDDIVRGGC